jgi:pantetheine-phosphate adenylyltransferase
METKVSKGPAVFVGSFDPFTLGHKDIVERAAKIFGSVLVGIGKSAGKQNMFDPTERLEMIQEIFAKNALVEVKTFDGLATKFAMDHKASVLVRGVRASGDFSYEINMALTNDTLCPKIATIFLPAKAHLQHISSSLVREVAAAGGDISEFVPAPVKRRMQKKVRSSS